MRRKQKNNKIYPHTRQSSDKLIHLTKEKRSQQGNPLQNFSGLVLGKRLIQLSYYLIYQPSEKFWQNISYIKNCLSWYWIRNWKISVVINFSVVRTHLVHFSVQVTTWWWYKYSRGLICAEGLCIGFIDIVASIRCIPLISLLFRQQLSLLPVLLSNHPAKLSFGGVSALGIIDYRHCHQLFLLWRLKVLFQNRLRKFSSFSVIPSAVS